MFLDASAIVAILGRETGHEEIERRLLASDSGYAVSPLVKFEATVALARQKTIPSRGRPSPHLLAQAGRAVEALVQDLGAEELTITPEIGRRALETAAVYGKAVDHAADLNFGDCFAYACAKVMGMPLLYKGEDFARTDLA